MAKKRGNGEGSLSQLPSGNWRAKISINSKRLSYTAKTQRECFEWIKQTKFQIEHGNLDQAVKKYLGLDEPTTKRNTRARFVYLIREQHGMVKIGKAVDIQSRFMQLELSVPYNFVFQLVVQSEFADDLEHKLHIQFDKKRVKGEWFQLSGDDIAEAVKYLFLATSQEKNIFSLAEIIVPELDVPEDGNGKAPWS